LDRFVALADQFTKSQTASANVTRKQIDAIAKEYGLNPENITRDYDDTPEPDQSNFGGGGSAYQQYVNRRRKGGG
jgi:hypothetical protein